MDVYVHDVVTGTQNRHARRGVTPFQLRATGSYSSRLRLNHCTHTHADTRAVSNYTLAEPERGDVPEPGRERR